MFILRVIPITRLPLDKPQIYSYFTSQELSRGGLVLAPLYKRQVKAVVFDIRPISQFSKMEIRKASFELKQIIKVLSERPILSENQLELIDWMTRYYYAPLGLIVKTVLPEKLMKNLKWFSGSPIKNKPGTDENKDNYPKKLEQHYVWDNYIGRIKIYIQEIKNVLKNKNQILILTPQLFQINIIKQEISRYFPGISIAGVSSESKITELRKTWLDINNNNTRIIIGTRSSIFLPFKNLKLIIIDQEENSGHISWDMSPKYDVKKVAEKLAELHNAKLVFGGNIPSVEYYHKLSPIKKLQVASYGFRVIDMRDEIRKGNYSIFSDALLDKLKYAVRHKRKAVLFVNRRGTFRFVMCRDCGLTVKCKNCEVPMVCHEPIGEKKIGILKCHHCGFKLAIPSRCLRCGGTRIKGFGIGTQRVVQELKKIFPQTNILRIDSDVSKSSPPIRLADKFQIVVGTQMIFSLPGLKKTDLVGIISIDSMLNLPDWHSGEKTFQIISKLGNLSDQVLIQTYNPESFIIQTAAKSDYENFYDKEIEQRKELFYPPFSRLIKLTYRDKIGYRAQNQAQQLESLIKKSGSLSEHFDILGPTPAFIPKEKNKWIWQIVLKIKDEKAKSDLLKLIPGGWEIEVDPESLL